MLADADVGLIASNFQAGFATASRVAKKQHLLGSAPIIVFAGVSTVRRAKRRPRCRQNNRLPGAAMPPLPLSSKYQAGPAGEGGSHRPKQILSGPGPPDFKNLSEFRQDFQAAPPLS